MTSVAERVFGELHESEPIYAVVDGARNPAVQAWAASDGAAAWCLHRGTLPKPLREVAPYLRRIGRGHEHTQRFFEAAWGDAWGVLFTSPAPSRELRRHLRRYLRVRNAAGGLFAFRWFDPRVLRVFLPTLTSAELIRFFGPINAFAIEEGELGAFHLFRLGEQGLSHRLVGPAPAFETSELPRTGLEAAAHARRDDPALDPTKAARRHLVPTISHASMDALGRASRAAFVERLGRELRARFPAAERLFGPRIGTQVELGIIEAQKVGLTSEREIAGYLHFWFESGFNFERRWPGSTAVLKNARVPGEAKLALLTQLAR